MNYSDLTPLESFLWGFLKTKVHLDLSENITEMPARIETNNFFLHGYLCITFHSHLELKQIIVYISRSNKDNCNNL